MVRRTPLRFVATLVAAAFVAAACGDDDDEAATATNPPAPAPASNTTTAPAVAPETAGPPTTPEDAIAAAQARVEAAQAALADAQNVATAARDQLCVESTGYLEALDRYGHLLVDSDATVGDVNTLGADLVAPREAVTGAASAFQEANVAVAEAQQSLADAEHALAEAIAVASSVAPSTTTPGTTTTTTLVPRASVERAQQAEDDLAQVAAGITDATPLREATAEYNSAAFALQIAWLRLLFDAGCLTDDQEAQAVELVTDHTTSLQTDLQRLGYYDGAIDGIYGPGTVEGVKRLQADSGLRETGFVDEATSRALAELLAELDQQDAVAGAAHTAAVQAVLTLTGFWTGPVDGQWTEDLTAALQAFQTELGVEPTGVVDAATLAAFEQALSERESAATTTTTTVPTTSPPTPPTTSPRPSLTTAAPTPETNSAPATDG